VLPIAFLCLPIPSDFLSQKLLLTWLARPMITPGDVLIVSYSNNTIGTTSWRVEPGPVSPARSIVARWPMNGTSAGNNDTMELVAFDAFGQWRGERLPRNILRVGSGSRAFLSHVFTSLFERS